MIKEIKDVERFFEIPLGEHPEFFYDVGFGNKWSKSK